ncbi:MAG: outer membrane lipid asymmetry maintenance protein MlaD, partial [Chromatiaceae bacterium]
MSRMRTMEILVGAFMAGGFVALFFLAMKVSNLSAETIGEGYPLAARFDNVGSLKVRAPVTMAGVRIGRVQSIRFDKTRYEAVVTLNIGKQYNTIPIDTFASIYTQG